MKLSKNKLLVAAVILSVLAISFFYNTAPSEVTVKDEEIAETSLETEKEVSFSDLDEEEDETAPEEEKEEVTAFLSDKASCTLSVRCDNAVGKIETAPPDGVIFPETETEITEGESVFDVLYRLMRENGIHMEFVNTPMYNSAYIEGIGNLYEYDLGELSGWMYSVNGVFPGYGCSEFKLSDGDKVQWVYTCDLGKDVGGYFADGGEKNE